MCTRFIHRGKDIITAFNFDIDTAVWKHKVIKEADRFFIGIMRPDGIYHSYHGVNKNGNAGTLLYVHENPRGIYYPSSDCLPISLLTEKFIRAELSFDDVLNILETKRIVYAEDATMQAMLTDKEGRSLIIEPGIGHRQVNCRYSLITNYSILNPESTREFIVPGDDRYERAKRILDSSDDDFSVWDAFSLLREVHQEGPWATRVSFVYSVKENAVYYTENNDFDHIKKYAF